MSQQHRRVTASNGRPLSSVIPFKTKKAKKRFLKANDQFSTIQLYGLGPPVVLYIAPPEDEQEGQEGQEGQPKGQPSPSNQQMYRRRIRRRAEKHQ